MVQLIRVYHSVVYSGTCVFFVSLHISSISIPNILSSLLCLWNHLHVTILALHVINTLQICTGLGLGLMAKLVAG